MSLGLPVSVIKLDIKIQEFHEIKKLGLVVLDPFFDIESGWVFGVVIQRVEKVFHELNHDGIRELVDVFLVERLTIFSNIEKNIFVV